MANEFKIKTGLLIGPSVGSQPVTSIKDTSISITTDASSILVTGKAVYDFVTTNQAEGYWALDGSILSPSDDTVNVQLSAIQIGTDAGVVSVIDMDVSSAAVASEQSYSFNIDGTEIAKVYAEGDGAGGIQEPAFKVIESLYGESSVYFTGIPDISTSYLLFYNPTTDEVTYADTNASGVLTNLGALTDVSIGGTLQDGSVLSYNSTQQLWTPGARKAVWGTLTGNIGDQMDISIWLTDLSINKADWTDVSIWLTDLSINKLSTTGGTLNGYLVISSGGLSVTNDVSIGGNLNLTGDAFFNGDLTINGSLNVVGVNTLDVSTAFIRLNEGLIGAPPPNLQSGIVVNRGTLEDYIFAYDEDNQQFRIGITVLETSTHYSDSSTQAVATREDDPVAFGIGWWNDDVYRIDTSTGFLFDGSLYVPNNLKVGDEIYAPNIERASQDKIVFYNSGTGQFTYLESSTAALDTSTFISLSDTPNSYNPVDASPGMAVVINDSGNGLEFGPRIWREESDEVTLANEDANVLFYQYIELEGDAGIATFVDKDVTASSALGTEETYRFNLDGNTIAEIYGESNGAGGIQEQKFVSVASFLAEASVYMSGIPDISTGYVLFYDPGTDQVTYAAGNATGGVADLAALTDVSIGGTIPDGSALIYNSTQSLWTYGVAGGAGGDYWTLDGSTLVPTDSTVDVKLGEIIIDTDAGAVTLVDMDVSSAVAASEQSYAFNIDGSTVAKVYGAATTDGSALAETGFVVETVQYMGDPNTNGSWRFYPDSAGDLVFEKRISGTWTEKGKFTE